MSVAYEDLVVQDLAYPPVGTSQEDMLSYSDIFRRYLAVSKLALNHAVEPNIESVNPIEVLRRLQGAGRYKLLHRESSDILLTREVRGQDPVIARVLATEVWQGKYIAIGNNRTLEVGCKGTWDRHRPTNFASNVTISFTRLGEDSPFAEHGCSLAPQDNFWKDSDTERGQRVVGNVCEVLKVLQVIQRQSPARMILGRQ